MLADLDADADGKISREEAGEGPASRMFDRADADEDGFVTKAEARTAMESMGGGFGGGRGGARGGRRNTGAAPIRKDGKPLSELVGGPRYVSMIAVSKFKKDRVFLTLDGHRSDDDRPLAFVSEDGGDTWSSLNGSLPPGTGSTRTIAEDRDEPDLLYLGTEFGAWALVRPRRALGKTERQPSHGRRPRVRPKSRMRRHGGRDPRPQFVDPRRHAVRAASPARPATSPPRC
jgi:hypothetical protein